jgi:hypothetical protein
MGCKGARKITDNGEEKMTDRDLKKQMPQIVSLTTICCLLSTVLTGCGYTTRSMISNEFKTIYVVPFMNKIDITQETDVASKYRIYRPMLESDITRYVTNKFLSDGNLKPVKGESADLILKGEVIEFRKDPLRYNDSDEVTEYRINLVVNIGLWNRKEDKLVWEEKQFTGDTTYFTSFASGDVTKKTDDTAISDALDDLARRIVERTVEQW